RVSARLVGYALGSALENHDEEGVGSDPRFGENNTFYLHAMAVLPTVQNAVEIENLLLESLRTRAIPAGFEFLSTLIEDRLRDTAHFVIDSFGCFFTVIAFLRHEGNRRNWALCGGAISKVAEPIAHAEPRDHLSDELGGALEIVGCSG